MSESTAQSYASHRRFDPAFHFVLFGILLLNLARAVKHGYLMFRYGTFAWGTLFETVLAAALILLALKVRIYALHNQDRLIRLEETLRLQRLLPESLKARIGELRVGQFVALRFASDEELPELVAAALQEQLGKEAIKKRIRTWRPDTFRV